MPTTTNFGWTTPADTDLVKDGASAMRTLGNGIDTSLVYLKGGTTGQILSKTSNTDLAFSWINNDQGDLTAITAGTGISVTSGTGPIPTVAIDTATTVDKTTAQTLTNKTLTAPIISTISNTGTLTLPTSTDTLVGRATTDTLTNKTISGSSNTISNVSLTTGVTGTLPVGNGGTNLTTYTTGDLPYASAANTLSKLAIGTTGQVLTVSGGVPTWATAGGSSFAGCSVYSSGGLTLTGGVSTNITWDTEFFDTDAFHSTSSNTTRFTVPSGKAGKYLFTANIWLTSSGQQELYVRKNGGAFRRFDFNTNATRSNVICDVYDLAVGDYINLESYSGSTLNLSGGTERSTASFIYLGA